MTTGEVEITMGLDGLATLALFLQKWECTAELTSLFRAVKLEVLEGRASPIRAFWFACNTGNASVAQTALKNREWTWNESTEKVEGVHKRNVWDPAAWPLSEWHKVNNIDFVFALHRAYDQVGNTDGLADKFAEWLALAKASK